MTAIWTQPRSWSVGELTTAALMNQQLRDNLDWLKTPPQGVYNTPAALVITNNVYADIMSPITVTSAGGGFLVGLQACANCSATVVTLNLDVQVDGVSQGGSTGVIVFNGPAAGLLFNASFVFYVSPKPAGSHTFKLRAFVNTGSSTIYAISAGTSAQF